MTNKIIKTLSLGLASLSIGLALTSCGNNNESTSDSNTGSSQPSSSVSNFDTSKKITAYTRDTTSGTRDGFFTKIGMSSQKASNEGLVSGYVEVSSNGDMVNSIKNDEYGIGYISLSSLEGSGLNGLNYNNVEPTEANVLNNTYELTRNFNYVIRNDYASDSKVGQIVAAFVAYMSTSTAKAIIKSNDGILTIKTTDKSWDEIKANYPICNEDNSSIKVSFGGSTSVEKIAKKLTAAFSPLCGNFIAEHNHTGSGDAYKHTQGSEKDAATGKLDIGFLSRELESNEAAAENTSGKICTDAIVAVVNSKNPLKNADSTLLSSIYKGSKTVWKDVM